MEAVRVWGRAPLPHWPGAGVGCDRALQWPSASPLLGPARPLLASLPRPCVLALPPTPHPPGMVDDGERGDMAAPLDKRLRHLEITGAGGRQGRLAWGLGSGLSLPWHCRPPRCAA